MDYGTPKKVAGTLTLTGMTLGEQAVVILAALILITATAIMLRSKWRKGKKINE
jgi:hypothetical protein